MTSSSADRRLGDRDPSGPAVQWAPEEFIRLPDGLARVPNAMEQDELIAAIAEANAAREREFVEEIDRRVAESYSRGFEEGRREGEQAEAARLRTAVQAAEDAIDSLREGESRWRDGLEENICALAVAIAKQVLEREIRGSPQAVLDLVRRAIHEFPIDQPVRIRVSPADLALLASDGPDKEADTAVQGRETRWISDPLIAPGGCVVEGRDRIVDGRVDSALERIYRRLTYTSA